MYVFIFQCFFIFRDHFFLTYFSGLVDISVFLFSHVDIKALLHLWNTCLYHPDFASVVDI